MIDTQALLWTGAATGASTAILAGWREHRRVRRADPDAVGMIDWPTVQMLALIGVAVCGLLALH